MAHQMLKFLANQVLRVVRMRDNSVFVGRAINIGDQKLQVMLFGETDLAVGDEVKFACGGDSGYDNIFAAVIGLEHGLVDLWITDQKSSGLDRAQRIVAPGTTALLISESYEHHASVCDLSTSGMRVKTFGYIEPDEVITVKIHSLNSPITLSCRVARVVKDALSDSCELGIQIMNADSLSVARYNHFVESLLRKQAQAA